MAVSEERETIIRLMPSCPGQAFVWTTEPKYWRRFQKAGFKPGPGSTERGKFYELPAKMFLVRARVPPKRTSVSNLPSQKGTAAKKGQS